MLEELGEVRELDVFPLGDAALPRPGDELVEQRLVSLLRVLGLPALVAKGEEEIFGEGLHHSLGGGS